MLIRATTKNIHGENGDNEKDNNDNKIEEIDTRVTYHSKRYLCNIQSNHGYEGRTD